LEDQLNAKSIVAEPLEVNESASELSLYVPGDAVGMDSRNSIVHHITASKQTLHLVKRSLSPWSRSFGKRAFDLAFVFALLPVLLPILLAVALAVRLTSRGPVLFFQKRTGCFGRDFTIIKFRTMLHLRNASHHAVTTTENQRFTVLGPFLRRWKLDELPQVFNVLRGEMSVIGPRPKLPHHQVGQMCCKPGLTGAATLAFAQEEAILAVLPKHELDVFYHTVVLPFKQELDDEYMARATFASDVKLILDTAMRKWDSSAVVERLFREREVEMRRTVAAQNPSLRETVRYSVVQSAVSAD
jgi:lipopolysaccharide/colanic/teichoic acid biosynthesis glycosyltransferase